MVRTTSVPRTATDIAAEVHARPESAAGILQGCLDRIAAVDPLLGAFQVVCADAAQAEAAELARRDVSALPLAGVPVAVKDNVAVRGLPTRFGSAATSATAAEEDDELVRRLRAAGAIIVGTTRMPELAAWSFTESPVHGGTANPWDVTRNAGGSTGGGASAVAAGLVPVALGSDGGGSLRIPAAYCGVVGYKPARGIVPLAGGLADHWYGCSVFGCITSSVADAALVTDVLAGVTGVPIEPAAGPLRIAVSLRSPTPIGRPDRVARAGVARTAGVLRAAGHRVTSDNPPYGPTLVNAWCQHWLAGIARDAERLGLADAELEPRTLAMVRRGRRLTRRGRPNGTAQDRWTERVGGWFERYDVLISPTVARRAPKLGALRDSGYLRSYLFGATATPYTQAWNLSGFPALTMPVLNGEGRPLEVQLVAPVGHETTLLGLALQLEQSLGRAPSGDAGRRR